MQRIERTDGRLNVLAFDPHHGQRLSLPEIEDLRVKAVIDLRHHDRNLKLAGYAIYAGLFAFCFAFWRGVFWLLER